MNLRLGLTWATWQWWSMGLSGGLFVAGIYMLAALTRQQFVRLRLVSGKTLQRWRGASLSWGEYRKHWGSALFGQLVTWVFLYAAVLAFLNRGAGFWGTLIQYTVFSLLVLGPFAAATLLMTWWQPTAYILTENGVGSISWSLFSVGRSAGLQDSSYRPWSNVRGYYWDEGNLVLMVRPTFWAPERFTLVVPPGERRNLEDLLRDRGLNKMPKDSGDRQGKGRSSRSRDRSGGGGRGR